MRYSAIFLIYNPNSTGQSEELAKSFRRDLRSHLPDMDIQLRPTKYAGHAEELAYDIAKQEKRPLIISSSGDGGYHEVINGALRAQAEGAHPTTGLLPAGNANDHYHNLHEENMVDKIKKGQADSIDVLLLEGTADGKRVTRYAHSYIGFGLTPQVGKELNKVKLNPVKEVWTVGKSLFEVKPVRLQLNKKSRLYESIIFSNVDVMSKYLKVSRPSSVTDGKFEVTIFRRRNKLQLLLTLLRASVSGVREDQQVRSYELLTIHPTLVQLDGEIMKLDAHSNVRIRNQKQLLNCII